MKGEQCPRCRKGQLCRFDPRDAEPSCLACGFVPYEEDPLPYVPDGRQREYIDPDETVERRLETNRRYAAKKRGHPPSRRGLAL